MVFGLDSKHLLSSMSVPRFNIEIVPLASNEFRKVMLEYHESIPVAIDRVLRRNAPRMETLAQQNATEGREGIIVDTINNRITNLVEGIHFRPRSPLGRGVKNDPVQLAWMKDIGLSGKSTATRILKYLTQLTSGTSFGLWEPPAYTRSRFPGARIGIHWTGPIIPGLGRIRRYPGPGYMGHGAMEDAVESIAPLIQDDFTFEMNRIRDRLTSKYERVAEARAREFEVAQVVRERSVRGGGFGLPGEVGRAAIIEGKDGRLNVFGASAARNIARGTMRQTARRASVRLLGGVRTGMMSMASRLRLGRR